MSCLMMQKNSYQVSGLTGGCSTFVEAIAFTSHFVALDLENPGQVTTEKRSLGLLVCRGTAVMTVSPMEGRQQIENPFKT